MVLYGFIPLYFRCGENDEDYSIDFSAVSLKTRVKDSKSDTKENCFSFENKVVICMYIYHIKKR